MKNFIAKTALFIYLLITFFCMSCENLCLIGAGMLILLLITVQGGFKTFWERLCDCDESEEQKKKSE